MTKPSQRRPARYDQSGCIWGLISILDFRHGSRSPRRLLTDKRHGTTQTFDEGDIRSDPKLSTYEEDNLPDLIGGGSPIVAASDAPANKPSVKSLIEEEMVSEHPELHNERHEDRKRKIQKGNMKSSRESLDFDALGLCDAHESFNSFRCPCNHTPDGSLAYEQNGNDIVLDELCNHINQKGINEVCLELKQKVSGLDVKEKLQEAIKEFISREVANEKNLRDNERVNFSNKVVDALQVPNLDEDSFLKLLKDQASFRVENSEVENTEVLDLYKDSKDSGEMLNNNHGTKQRKFFRRYIKSPEMKSPQKGKKGSDSDTIVILKPDPSPLKCTETGASPDSLSDPSRHKKSENARASLFLAAIKRRWKNVMRKEQHSYPVLKKPSSRFRRKSPEKKSSSKDHFFIEKMAKPRESSVGTESETVVSPMQRVPNIYIEARKHLSEMLNSGHEEATSPPRVKSPKTLARILALSEFNSPVPSPRTNWELSSATGQMRRSDLINDQAEKIDEDSEQQVVENNAIPVINIAIRDIKIKEGDASSAPKEDTASEDDASYMIKSNDMTLEESRDLSDTSEYIEATSENPKQIEETENFEEEFIHDDTPPSSLFGSPPSSSVRKKDATFGDNPDRPSPVSVLEPLFTEDLSPARTARRSLELTTEPVKIKFEDRDKFTPIEKDTIFKGCMEADEVEEMLLLYVRAVLHSCGLNWNELYLKSQLSDQLLEPCLYEEADSFCNCSQYDQNLVFDCINEVLLEVCYRYFWFCPRVSYTKPTSRPITDLKDAIIVVWERVRGHLFLMPLPQTLEQIVHKDITKNEYWMDLKPDIESIGFETGDEILDELIEDYVGEILDSLYASRFVEVEESGNNISLCLDSLSSDSKLICDAN